MWKVGAQASFGDEASSGEVEIKGEYIHIPCKIWVLKLLNFFTVQVKKQAKKQAEKQWRNNYNYEGGTKEQTSLEVPGIVEPSVPVPQN